MYGIDTEFHQNEHYIRYICGLFLTYFQYLLIECY